MVTAGAYVRAGRPSCRRRLSQRLDGAHADAFVEANGPGQASNAGYALTVPAPTLDDIVRALRLGPATPDALRMRLGGDVDRDAMWWAVDEAVRQGLVSSTAEIQCGPDGLCGTSVPTVFSLARG